MNYWLDIVRFARREQWDMAGFVFGEMWYWADMNAMLSHDERPWSPLAYSQMLSRLYPNQIPF